MIELIEIKNSKTSKHYVLLKDLLKKEIFE
jgi:hypothetical protein